MGWNFYRWDSNWAYFLPGERKEVSQDPPKWAGCEVMGQGKVGQDRKKKCQMR